MRCITNSLVSDAQFVNTKVEALSIARSFVGGFATQLWLMVGPVGAKSTQTERISNQEL